MSREEDLRRIGEALDRAREILEGFTPGEVAARKKEGGDPVTDADEAIDRALRETLPGPQDGWLSEESVDDAGRLSRERVWVVDPLDGTKEFLMGLPEFCVSVALTENGKAVAGGIFNPLAGHTILGSLETGVTLNGKPCRTRQLDSLEGIEVLASRSETRRGEWDRFDSAPFGVKAMGSVAYKLGLVAAGLADATWTLVPKNEWDVAAGTALVNAAGGEVLRTDGVPPTFNRADTLLPGLLAAPAGLMQPIRTFLGEAASAG